MTYLKQGIGLGLLFLLLACNPEKPVKGALGEYWTALVRGDIRTAHSFLSAADQKYIDETAFRAFLLEQSALDFLRLAPKRLQAEVEAAEPPVAVSDLSVNGQRAQALVSVRAPDLKNWLGAELYAALAEASPTTLTETRLLRKFHVGVALPEARTPHRLNLVRESGAWRLSFPRWRARAMLERAKALSADRDLGAAKDILDTLSGFSGELGQVTRLSVIREARRARRALPYLERVRLTGFRRTAPTPRCAEAASVNLVNGTELPVEAVSGVIEFSGKRRVVGRQSVRLKPLAPVAPGAQVALELCLKPPKAWSGEAEAWVGWLVFTEAAYKKLAYR